MSNLALKTDPEAMAFTDLLDEYIQERQQQTTLSEEERRRLAEIKYEINVRCPPKNNS